MIIVTAQGSTDVYRRQILTSKIDSRGVTVNILTPVVFSCLTVVLFNAGIIVCLGFLPVRYLLHEC